MNFNFLLKRTNNISNEIWLHYNKDPIFVYQMGKVGSTSIERSLKNSHHFHTLYANFPDLSPTLAVGFGATFLFKSYHFFKRFIINRNSSVKIICPVRNPIKRSVSMFYQDLPFLMTRYYQGNESNIGFDRENNPNLLLDIYSKLSDHDYCDTWFDKEILRFTSINIFDYNFEKRKPLIIKKGKYEVFIFRIEDLSYVFEELQEFSNQKINLKNTNLASEKWYAPLMKTFNHKSIPYDHITRIKEGMIYNFFKY